MVDGSAHATSTTAVLIPVKDFRRAKTRLIPALAPEERAELARTMATQVAQAARPLHVAVVCDDDEVAAWADGESIEVIWCPGTGLNGAVQQGFAELGEAGFGHVIIAHSDLPLVGRLEELSPWCGVTLVPDRHRAGTNVISLPTHLDFGFAYGTGSFRRHVIEAVRLRHGLRIVHDPDLGWDVDYPDDLKLPEPTRPLET